MFNTEVLAGRCERSHARPHVMWGVRGEHVEKKEGTIPYRRKTEMRGRIRNFSSLGKEEGGEPMS